MSVPRITKEELKEQLESMDSSSAPIILDVRLKYPYEHSSTILPRSIRMTEDHIDTSKISKERTVVAYDSDPDELVSARVTANLIRLGYRARALQGGIGEWLGAKFPAETKTAPQQAPPKPGSLK
jgi:rhodanese-related sulfurtransferase